MAIPQGQRKADELMPVGDAHNSVFAPTIGARPGMIVWKELPSRAVRAVVFADSPPLALGKVRSPALPMDFALPSLFEASLFSVHSYRNVRRQPTANKI